MIFVPTRVEGDVNAKPSRKQNTFDASAVLKSGRCGELKGPGLRKAIQKAQNFGLKAVADELAKFVVDPASFAGDAAPPEVRERIARGIAALKAMGHPLTRTVQMIQRHGVIETVNRIALYDAASLKNFAALRAAGLTELTAEAVVLDYPHLFDPKMVALARKRLPDWKVEAQ